MFQVVVTISNYVTNEAGEYVDVVDVKGEYTSKSEAEKALKTQQRMINRTGAGDFVSVAIISK